MYVAYTTAADGSSGNQSHACYLEFPQENWVLKQILLEVIAGNTSSIDCLVSM